MIDIHNHILPGIDDGARNMEEALKLCRLAKEDGIAGLVATPHIRDGLYANNRKTIIEKTNELREFIAGEIDIEIYSGAEVHISTNITERVKNSEIPTINDNGYLLLELPETLLPPHIEELIFNLKLEGITPIIAHPERYGWIKNEITQIKKFREMGALTQITAKSLTGGFGRGTRSIARELLKEGLVAVIASDSHSPDYRPPKLSGALKEAALIIGKERAAALVRENPGKIINGEPI